MLDLYVEIQTEAGHKTSEEKTRVVIITEDDKSKKQTTTEEDDYKAKLTENRRLAREKAERESAEAQARAEEQRYAIVHQLHLTRNVSKKSLH